MRCPHGCASACAHPGCPAGVLGEQLVVAGPETVAYFERASEVVWRERRASGVREDRRWRWVEVRRVPVNGGRVACLSGS
jgi:hypothetical protein